MIELKIQKIGNLSYVTYSVGEKMYLIGSGGSKNECKKLKKNIDFFVFNIKQETISDVSKKYVTKEVVIDWLTQNIITNKTAKIIFSEGDCILCDNIIDVSDTLDFIKSCGYEIYKGYLLEPCICYLHGTFMSGNRSSAQRILDKESVLNILKKMQIKN